MLPLLLACAAVPATAAAPPNPQIDYAGYRQLANEVEGYRQTRLISWDDFVTAAAEPDVLILDARTARQFAAGHIEGAVNLPLPEFSEESLAAVIGRTDRPILIYCNNNFRNDVQPVVLKSMPLALNLSTFVHLVGYGYRNVRELSDVMDFNDPQVRWVTGGGYTP
ncbi:rhodanese-like domain-containing protein [Sphingosinicella sp. LHD-64]|uniref:rhodanese-like domain-containing protein n=1 Tax=Sphingosinicella sp. LHD-64 TaxID=3072139 RepID=UPI00280E0421|nr:rhodanese-like domain-containing protein [Sphingosinicella sp. LHD-64]MDQ8757079.1 rhodanese-like domain-containing protein [Sphingosinicella sp. LHD-64]